MSVSLSHQFLFASGKLSVFLKQISITSTSQNDNWHQPGQVISRNSYPVFSYITHLGISYMFAVVGLLTLNQVPIVSNVHTINR